MSLPSDFTGLGEVLVNLTNRLTKGVGWIANRETSERIAIDTYIEEIQRGNCDSLTKAALIFSARKSIKSPRVHYADR